MLKGLGSKVQVSRQLFCLANTTGTSINLNEAERETERERESESESESESERDRVSDEGKEGERTVTGANWRERWPLSETARKRAE